MSHSDSGCAEAIEVVAFFAFVFWFLMFGWPNIRHRDCTEELRAAHLSSINHVPLNAEERDAVISCDKFYAANKKYKRWQPGNPLPAERR